MLPGVPRRAPRPCPQIWPPYTGGRDAGCGRVVSPALRTQQLGGSAGGALWHGRRWSRRMCRAASDVSWAYAAAGDDEDDAEAGEVGSRLREARCDQGTRVLCDLDRLLDGGTARRQQARTRIIEGPD